MRDTRSVTAPDWPAVARTVLRAPFTRCAWSEAAYCLIGFPVAAVGFVLLVALLAVGTVLTVSLLGAVVGALLLVAGLRLARALAAVHRACAALDLVIEEVREPMLDPADIPAGAHFDPIALHVPVALVFRLRRY